MELIYGEGSYLVQEVFMLIVMTVNSDAPGGHQWRLCSNSNMVRSDGLLAVTMTLFSADATRSVLDLFESVPVIWTSP